MCTDTSNSGHPVRDKGAPGKESKGEMAANPLNSRCSREAGRTSLGKPNVLVFLGVCIKIGVTAEPDTRTERSVPVDCNKHISQKNNTSTGQNQIKYANLLLLLLLNIVFNFSFFQFINKSIHIYIPLYFCLLFVILVLYMNPFREPFFF